MIRKPVTRRTFLASLAVVVAAPVVAACQQAPAAVQTQAPQVVEKVVTQIVEVQQTVEVEKQVEVTKIVEQEVIVTATAAPEGPVTVEFIYSGAEDTTSPSGVWLHDRIAAFEEANPNTTIKQTEMPWVGQREVLITRLVAGDAPDLAILHSNHAAEIGSAMGGLAAMEDLLDWDKYQEIFIPARLATVASQGKHYGVPWFGIVFGVVCHKPTFEEVGLDYPKTWTEFRAAAKATTVEGTRYGWGAAMGQGLDSAYRVYPFVLANGGRFMDDDLTKFTFNDKANQEALQLFLDLKADGSAAPGMESWTGANEADAFPATLLAMAIGGPWIPLWEKDPAKLDNWALIPLPRPEAPSGAKPSMTLSDDIMLSILQQSTRKEQAFALIQFLQNAETATERAVRPELVALPVVKAALEDPRWKETWGHEAYDFELAHSEPWPYTPVLGEAQNLYSLAVSKAYGGQDSVQGALDEGTQKAQALIVE